MSFDETKATIIFRPKVAGRNIIRLRIEDPGLAYRVETLVVRFIYTPVIKKKIKIIQAETPTVEPEEV